MLTDPPPVNPEVETTLEISEEDVATLQPTFPKMITFHMEMGRYVCSNKGNTLLVGQTQYEAGSSGKTKRYCIILITYKSFSNTIIHM